MQEALELREDAMQVAARITEVLDGDDVARACRRIGEAIDKQPVGAVMVGLGVVIADMALRAPDAQMFLAVLMEMIGRAMETRPDDVAVH